MSETFKICVLASGSKGNCVYLKAGETECLIDAGLSCREIEKRLKAIGANAGTIRHIFMTHEHVDHIQGLPVFTKKYSVHVHMNQSMYLHAGSMVSKKTYIHLFEDAFTVDQLLVEPFSILHDAIDPVGYCFHYQGKKASVLTDVGYATQLVKEKIKQSNVLILESNHDERLLMEGRYPWPLKQRIASRVGHLSNRQAAALIQETIHPELKHIILAHLSEENNRPSLAMETLYQHLTANAVTFSHIDIGLAHQHHVGDVVIVN
ncbi:MBL fold metallo-hydrolase [bacterium]|nr:MBL fold metallo-hydrolase [bacterium]